jgi:lipoprotein-anchoring transpeptidase ErfK/SrfK
MPHIGEREKSSRQLHRGSSIQPLVKSCAPRCLVLWLLGCGVLLGCQRREPPGALDNAQAARGAGQPLQLSVGPAGENQASIDADLSAVGDSEGTAHRGSADDDLPFEPTGQKLASIAWRTWIYTDAGPKRTRLGYLRAGQVVDARGPALTNSGCEGGWWRINPRGYVCVGKGASLDLSHPVVRASSRRAIRGKGFPYQYAKSKERAPERYFRLPTLAQMVEVEGQDVADRGPNFKVWAEQSGFMERLDIAAEAPDFLNDEAELTKPYGTKNHLRRQVHTGRASTSSGFALLSAFFHGGRAFGLSTELDLLPLDRLDLVVEPPPFSVIFDEGMSLPVAFHVSGTTTLWRRNERGKFVPQAEQRDRRGFPLTGNRATGGMYETSEGSWLASTGARVILPRDGFPSFATGRRKWIDISIGSQVLVAYEGQQPVFATLISSGRGGIGDQDDSNPEGERTVRGTFMIYEKSVSSTMDGDEDRADSYELQDVPFVQYFHRGFALHGAYWHNDFGKKRSHGCINLAPSDAAWLFEWTDPQVPVGWHASLNKQRGTVVLVRY